MIVKRKNVLIIWLDTSQVLIPDKEIDRLKYLELITGAKKISESLNGMGFNIKSIFWDVKSDTKQSLIEELSSSNYHVINISVGIITSSLSLLIFENVINIIAAYAPRVNISLSREFSDDIINAIKRQNPEIVSYNSSKKVKFSAI